MRLGRKQSEALSFIIFFPTEATQETHSVRCYRWLLGETLYCQSCVRWSIILSSFFILPQLQKQPTDYLCLLVGCRSTGGMKTTPLIDLQATPTNLKTEDRFIFNEVLQKHSAVIHLKYATILGSVIISVC